MKIFDAKIASGGATSVVDIGGGVISDFAQQTILSKCLENEVYTHYPLSKAYIRNVLKNIILTAEQEGQEVRDGFYDMYADFCQSEQQLAERCYKTLTYMIPDETISNLTRTLGHEGMLKATERRLVTLRVSLNMLDGDTGYSIWPAGLLLTEFLLNHPELVKGYSCLELGSGTGICGVWLSRLSCSKVLLTDGSLSTLVNLRHNLSINGIRPSGEDFHSDDNMSCPFQVECRQLMWEIATQEELDSFNAQVIIGADLIYDPTYLVPVLARLLRTQSKTKQGSNQYQGCDDDQINRSDSCQPRDVSLDENRSDGERETHPVAYLAHAIRNLETYEVYLNMVSREGLQLLDITESMSSPKCLPELVGFDRTQVRIHKVFFPSCGPLLTH